MSILIKNKENEIWENIIGYIGLYMISNFGRIKRLAGYRCKSERLMECNIRKDKYIIVHLSKNGKQKIFYVHQLVLETFIGPRPNGMVCRHLDGNRTNNKLENLRWGTYDENEQDKARHGTLRKGININTAKLKNKDILEIIELSDNGMSDQEISKKYFISRRNVNDIKNRKTWKHINVQ